MSHKFVLKNVRRPGGSRAHGRFSLVDDPARPGRGNTLQAPHIAVALLAGGLLKQLFTRIYFAGERLNGTDPVLSSIADRARHRTLVAPRAEKAGVALYRFDIVLQGEGETVFFEI